jgi:hypothetical protein
LDILKGTVLNTEKMTEKSLKLYQEITNLTTAQETEATENTPESSTDNPA